MDTLAIAGILCTRTWRRWQRYPREKDSEAAMTAKRLRWLRALARTTVVASAALHMSVSLVYQDMTPDGISYLDIADAYMRRDWHTAINSVWSPLYSWLLGPILASVPRSIYWEFRVVHLVNFGIFVVTFTAFEFFWTQLT